MNIISTSICLSILLFLFTCCNETTNYNSTPYNIGRVKDTAISNVCIEQLRVQIQDYLTISKPVLPKCCHC